MLDILITTLIKRPYVFIFLLGFLFLAIRRMGIIPTLIYLVWGYLIAWISEFFSIHYGFPYGLYHYVYENLQGEWLNHGVPVWDSLSYTFLTFAGFGIAEKIIPKTKKLRLTLLAAFFVTLLDIVIDPVAHQGEKWFLGKIYYYAFPGNYFDVPLSNFMGWYLVAFIIIGGFLFFDSIFQKSKALHVEKPQTFIDHYGVVAFYFGIFIFNWFITLWIGSYLLAIVDLFWISIPLGLLYRQLKKSS